MGFLAVFVLKYIVQEEYPVHKMYSKYRDGSAVRVEINSNVEQSLL